MKKGKTLIAFLLLLAIIIGIGSYFVSRSKVMKTLSSFETACQSMDVRRILNTIDPTVGQPVKVALAVLNATTEKEVTELMDGLVKTIFDTDLNSEDLLESLHFSNCHVTVFGWKATIRCRLNFEVAGVDFRQTAKVSLVRKDHEWYISGIKFTKTEK